MTARTRRLMFAGLMTLALAAVTTTVIAMRGGFASVPIVGAWIEKADPEWICPMHPDVRSHEPGRCPICGMALEQIAPSAQEQAHSQAHGAHAETASPAAGDARPGIEPGLERRAGIALDSRRQQMIGVRTVEVSRHPMGHMLRASGVVKADETRQSDVNLKVDGWIETLHVDYTGRYVARGEPLFALYSPELVAAQNEYLLALKSREQTSGSRVLEARQLADRLVEAARGRLSLWDLPESHIQSLERTRQVTRTIVFRSPASGVVIEKQAVKGMRVMSGQTLFRIVDLSRVWLEADVYEAELGILKRGTRAAISIKAFPERTFDARLTFVSPLVDDTTRTVRARFELANPDGLLKPGMFASVEISSAPRQALAIPTDSLLDTGRRQIVFVAEGDGYYMPRDVKAGARVNGHVEILEGLRAGERVASSALFFLDSESQLRAALEGYQSGPEAPTAGGTPAAPGLTIDVTTNPDPIKTGPATFIAQISDATGQAVTDADVWVVLYMPPMPSMNMPAMRSETRLSPLGGGGEYRGVAEVMMSGRWDATVTVTRDGTRLGSRQLTLVAR